MSEEQQHKVSDDQNAAVSGVNSISTAVDAGSADNNVDDKELELMKTQMAKMEQESARLVELQSQLEKDSSVLKEDKSDVDARSVYVGNVDYGSTPEELQKHFQASGAGPVNRVTILLDKYSGHPKGFAYIEFADPALVIEALKLNDSMFRGRPLKVTRKRTNIPGLARGRGRGRGRGGFRGRYRGAFRGRGGFNPY